MVFERLREGIRRFVDKVSKTEFTEKSLNEVLWDLQLTLVANDVSLEVAERICEEIKRRLVGRSVGRFEDRRALVVEELRKTIMDLFSKVGHVDLLEEASKARGEGRPLSVLFIGVNGTGKTTTICKVAKLLMDKSYKVVLACSDTFRAGAIEQLEEHARRVGVRVIRHRYGADPAAVAFDAVRHAEARGVDVVLIDTAGRMQTDRNLMDELRKIKRVASPDLTILVVDALTGNDAVEQARVFDSQVGFDAAILTKVDADVKGGSAISVAYETGKPIMYVGTGQGYGDLEPFNPEWLVERLLEEGKGESRGVGRASHRAPR